MHYIVLDFEWNQPLSEKEMIMEPFPFDSEIIEIGAVKLDESFHSVDEFKTFIRPQFYPHMSNAVVQLTKIRPQELEKAPSFPEAFDAFINWCGDDCALCSWGPDDIPVLLDNMLLHGIPIEPFPYCYDLQRIFARELLRENRQCSLSDAVKMLKLPADRAHDALNDTRNTVRVCERMDLAGCIDEYRTAFVGYGADRKNRLISGLIYPSLDAALADTRVNAVTCPYCGEQVALTLSPQEGNTLFGYGVCREGDEFLARIQHYRQAGNARKVKRIVYEMSDDLWDTYQQAKSAASPV